jgi:hypothetical protein
MVKAESGKTAASFTLQAASCKRNSQRQKTAARKQLKAESLKPKAEIRKAGRAVLK